MEHDFEHWWETSFDAPKYGLMKEHMLEAYKRGYVVGYTDGVYDEQDGRVKNEELFRKG